VDWGSATARPLARSSRSAPGLSPSSVYLVP
jgi:hypothetical protein